MLTAHPPPAAITVPVRRDNEVKVISGGDPVVLLGTLGSAFDPGKSVRTQIRRIMLSGSRLFAGDVRTG